MKKISLIALLLSSVLLLQNCKKDTVYATTSSTQPMLAYINDSTWNATSITAALTYNSATKSKIFICNGVGSNKQVSIKVTQHNATSTAGFAIANYNANTTTDNTFVYSIKTVNVATGILDYYSQGTVSPGSGTLVVSSIDSVKHTITGTFSFTTLQNTYDSGGNVTAVTVNQIASGGFNDIPYTFSTQ